MQKRCDPEKCRNSRPGINPRPTLKPSFSAAFLAPEVCFSGPTREVLDQYLLHHHGDVPKESPFLRTAAAELLVKTILGYREQGRFLLHGFAVMPEHLHVLLTPGNGQRVERCVQCIKGGFSFSVREQFAGEVWQTGFHEHRFAIRRISGTRSSTWLEIRSGDG